MKSFKVFLTEQVFDYNYFNGMSLANPIEYYDKVTSYDWLIQYHLVSTMGGTVASSYRTWKLHNENKSISCFLYAWLASVSREYDKEDSVTEDDGLKYPSEREYDDLLSRLHPDVVASINGKLMVFGDFTLEYNDKTDMLKDIPVFTQVTGKFILEGFKELKELPEWLPRFSKELHIINCNNITSLKGIDKIVKSTVDFLIINYNTHKPLLKSNVLGLCLINNLRNIDLDGVAELSDVVTKHLQKGRQGVMECQRDLIDAGYSDYAKM